MTIRKTFSSHTGCLHCKPETSQTVAKGMLGLTYAHVDFNFHFNERSDSGYLTHANKKCPKLKQKARKLLM